MPTACSPNSTSSRKTFATRSSIRRTSLHERSSVMADPVLKFPPEQKNNPVSPTSRPKLAAEPRRRLMAGMRRYRRFLLLVVLPLVALVAGVTVYLSGGRYVIAGGCYSGAERVVSSRDLCSNVWKVVSRWADAVGTGYG